MASNHTLFASIDVGGSSTKIIYQFNGSSQPQFFLMSPAVEQITLDDFKRYQSNLIWGGNPTPESQAYLEWKGSLFVVGDFASEFAAQDRLIERKYENALYKVLAAIGVILTKHNVTKKDKVTVDLAFLLPWNEFNDHQRFYSQLQQMFKGFKFRDQSWSITLSENFLCRPEGAGLLAIRTKTKGIDWLQQYNIVVLMIGHRNSTILYFEKGARKIADSPLLGFSSFLDQVCSRVSGIQRDQLAKAIFTALYLARKEVYSTTKYYTQHPDWQKLSPIRSLATAKDESLRNMEVIDIASSIQIATADYWFRLQKWLEKNLTSMPKEVILGGGAAAFIEPELEKYFNCQPNMSYDTKRVDGKRATSYTYRDDLKPRADLVWLENIQTQIQNTFRLGYADGEQEMPFRLIDCFGMMDQLLDKVKEVKGDKNQKNA